MSQVRVWSDCWSIVVLNLILDFVIIIRNILIYDLNDDDDDDVVE